MLRLEKENLWVKVNSKYIASFNYFDKSLIALSETSGSLSIASFATVIGAPIGIVSASFSFEFSVNTGNVKKLLKTTWSRNKKHNKIAMLARIKINSIENKLSEALISNETSHEDFTRIINEEKNYREINRSIRMMKSQRSDTEKNNLIEEGKKKALMKSLDKMQYKSIKQWKFQKLVIIQPICETKKSRFIKEQEACALSSSLGIKTPLSKIPLLGNILF